MNIRRAASKLFADELFWWFVVSAVLTVFGDAIGGFSAMMAYALSLAFLAYVIVAGMYRIVRRDKKESE